MSRGNTSVFYFSSTDFNFLLQRPQQLFRAWRMLGEAAFDFHYVEPPRTFLKPANWRGRADEPGVVRPFLPLPPNWLKGGGTRRASRNLVNSQIGLDKARRKVAIVSTCFWEPFVSRDDFDLICYDYLDSVEVFSTESTMASMLQEHERLLVKSDIIFTTADNLKTEVVSKVPQTTCVSVSNGVDYDFFQQMTTECEIKDYRRGSRRVVGYVGALFNWINVELIVDAARAMPSLDFVLVGPLSEENRKHLENSPGNVFFLGKKSYHEVPAYVSLFDVCLIPFNSSHISESTDPIKLYEYFSLGKPVVATPMKQLARYDNGCLLKTAEGTPGFIKAIEHFLSADNEGWRREREGIARENSWRSKAQTMVNEIKTSLR